VVATRAGDFGLGLVVGLDMAAWGYELLVVFRAVDIEE
jgi:hypothetical protein